MNGPPPQSRFQTNAPPHIGPLAPVLVRLLGQSRQRAQVYAEQVAARAAGLGILVQAANEHSRVLSARSPQLLSRLGMVCNAIVTLADTAATLDALISRERALQTEIQKVLAGLPPTMFTPPPAPTVAPVAPQGAMASDPTTQGQALTEALSKAEVMPTVVTQGLAPQTVTQISNVPMTSTINAEVTTNAAAPIPQIQIAAPANGTVEKPAAS